MTKPFYVTTPLYYVNAAPHIGHSYTQVAVDCLARYHRLLGEDAFFLTGTDEHGEKIAQAAAAKHMPPQAFVDEASGMFRRLWDALGIGGSYSRFIRTTDADHRATVQEALRRLQPSLQKGLYKFWYCVPCETSYGLQEIIGPNPVCPSCKRPVQQIEEEDYYLRLEPQREWLRGIIQQQEMLVLPVERRNELLGMLEQPLPDLCITRPKERVPWGIEVPFSPEHTVYVWVDALLNYLSALGWPNDPRFERYWNEAGAVHLIGKDILRHHALYWPIILKALGIKPPRMIFAHGWWKMGEQKMSKSLGNIVDPFVVVGTFLKDQPYASDVYRYFLLREVPFGQDGSFSEDAILIRLQADLGNDLGNLLHRTHSMIERYNQSRLPAAQPIAELDAATGAKALAERATALPQTIAQAMEQLQYAVALEAIMSVVSQANQYIEAAAPWKLAKQGQTEPLLHTLGTLAEVIRIVAIVLDPFMPSVAAAIWAQLGLADQPRQLADVARWPSLPPGAALGPRSVLFPRLDQKTV